MKFNPIIIVILITNIGLSSCGMLPSQTGDGAIDQLKDFKTIGSGPVLVGQSDKKFNSPIRVVFIEGDGARWTEFGTQPPKDPTPENSVVLKLANLTAELGYDVTYLGRPCQYGSIIELGSCDISDWTDQRYSAEQAEHLANAFTKTSPTASQRLIIVGHSGGGVMAIRLAYRLIKRGIAVDSINALAAPLDPDTWTNHNQFTSLNMDQYYEELRVMILTHCVTVWFGSNDTLVSARDLSSSIKQEFGSRIQVMPDATHSKGWSDSWTIKLFPIMLTSLVNCGEPRS